MFRTLQIFHVGRRSQRDFALKTRGFATLRADGDGTFSQGENAQKRP